MILLIFIPLFLVSYLVPTRVLKKEYTSTAVIENNAAIAQATYSLITNRFKADAIYESVAENLAAEGEKKLVHENGKPITASEISSGLSLSSYASNMVNFTISFKSSDSTIVQGVLAEYTSVALEVTHEAYPNLKLSREASKGAKTSNENKYFLIGAAASLVLALGIPFVYEIIADQVFDDKDIKAFGLEGFELRASGR